MRFLAAALTVATLALPAQEASLGARVQALVPMGDLHDLTNGQLGLGFAGFIEFPVGDAFRLRPSMGGQYFPKKTSAGLGGTEVTVSSVDLMLDALWFPGESTERGPYLVGGAGGQMWRVSPTGGAATSHTRLGLSGGLGYQFSPRLGFEARGFWSPVAPDLTATGLMVGATVRF